MRKELFILSVLIIPSCVISGSQLETMGKYKDCEECYNLFKQGEEENAFKCYKEKAEKGNEIAQLNLGIFYHTGGGVGQNDEEAVKWYTAAAMQGNAEAQDRLGHCYEKGTGVEKNSQKAFEWYMKAAKQGYDKALYNVGISYMGGYGVTKDVDEGIRWMQKSADTGYEPAISLIEFIKEHPERVEAEKKRP